MPVGSGKLVAFETALAAAWLSSGGGGGPSRLEGWIFRMIKSPDRRRSLSQIKRLFDCLYPLAKLVSTSCRDI